MKQVIDIFDSSMISEVTYDTETLELTVKYTPQYFIKEPVTFLDVPENIFNSFINNSSLGKFHNKILKDKSLFKTKTTTIMSEEKAKKQWKRIGKNRASDKTRFIELDLNVDKLNKDWIYFGKNGGRFYKLVFALKPDGQIDKYEQCGMLTQKVPSEVYNKDKTIKGPILGNGYEPDWEAMREENGSGGSANEANEAVYDPIKITEPLDDLPF